MIKKPHQNHFSSSFPISSLEIDGYLVTYEDNKDSSIRSLSKQEQKKYQDLLHEAQIHPKVAYKKTLDWQESKSDIKELDNLLTYLHLQNKQLVKAEELILASFEKYPDYLFAKINYADQCLRKNKLDQIPLIFPSFNLKELLPNKKSFHVSEFRGFMIFASHYHLEIKETALSRHYYENAKLADPLHPSVIFSEKTLFKKNILRDFLRKIVHLAHIP
jgi:hypothetical protein